MKAWFTEAFGTPEKVLRWSKGSTLNPGKGQVRIRVHAASLNFPDLLCIQGKYQVRPPLPFTPGTEAVGVVEECGAECSLFEEGTRVMGLATSGAFAEQMLLDESQAYSVPDSMPDKHASGFLMTHQTSYFALVHRARLQPGEVLLVHGAAGGVGTTAVQIGKALGATVIATAGSSEKIEICRECGADHVINYLQDDFVEAVKGITGGLGADVIYDPVGGEVLERSTKCIAWEGRLLVIGFAGGTIPSLAANRILLKNISIVGLYWGNYMKYNPALIRETQKRLYEMYEKDELRPVADDSFSMEQLISALDQLIQRKVHGKLVLTVPS